LIQVALRHDEERHLVGEVETIRIGYPEVLVGSIELDDVLAAQGGTEDGRGVAVAGVVSFSRLVFPSIKGTRLRFVGEVAVSVHVRSIQPKRQVVLGEGVGGEAEVARPKGLGLGCPYRARHVGGGYAVVVEGALLEVFQGDGKGSRMHPEVDHLVP